MISYLYQMDTNGNWANLAKPFRSQLKCSCEARSKDLWKRWFCPGLCWVRNHCGSKLGSFNDVISMISGLCELSAPHAATIRNKRLQKTRQVL